jgi:hypothetical protein
MFSRLLTRSRIAPLYDDITAFVAGSLLSDATNYNGLVRLVITTPRRYAQGHVWIHAANLTEELVQGVQEFVNFSILNAESSLDHWEDRRPHWDAPSQ